MFEFISKNHRSSRLFVLNCLLNQKLQINCRILITLHSIDAEKEKPLKFLMHCLTSHVLMKKLYKRNEKYGPTGHDVFFLGFLFFDFILILSYPLEKTNEHVDATNPSSWTFVLLMRGTFTTTSQSVRLHDFLLLKILTFRRIETQH